MNKIFTIPPKMLQQFADKAKAGNADYIHYSDEKPAFWLIYAGRQEICLLSLDPPCGHGKLQSAAEIKARKTNNIKVTK